MALGYRMYFLFLLNRVIVRLLLCKVIHSSFGGCVLISEGRVWFYLLAVAYYAPKF